MTDEQAKKLGALIRAAREAKGMSLRALEAESVIALSWLLYLEAGRSLEPLQGRVAKIAELLDVDPAKVGQTIDGVRVVSKLSCAPAGVSVALVCTSSYFQSVAPTLRELIARKIHVVSSGEEMAFPRYRNPQLAGEIDEISVSPVSLMPEGIEKQLKPREIADLFAFLTLDKPPSDPTARRIPGTPWK